MSTNCQILQHCLQFSEVLNDLTKTIKSKYNIFAEQKNKKKLKNNFEHGMKLAPGSRSYLTMYLDLLDKLETIKTQFRLVYFTNDFCFKH